MSMNEMIKIETSRKWVRCPYCNAKVQIYTDIAECRGVFPVCNRGCRKEFELIIRNGEQVFPDNEQ